MNNFFFSSTMWYKSLKNKNYRSCKKCKIASVWNYQNSIVHHKMPNRLCNNLRICIIGLKWIHLTLKNIKALKNTDQGKLCSTSSFFFKSLFLKIHPWRRGMLVFTQNSTLTFFVVVSANLFFSPLMKLFFNWDLPALVTKARKVWSWC